MSDTTLLARAVAADPTDITVRLALADSLQEAGDDVGAEATRLEAVAMHLRAALVSAGFDADRVYTLGLAKAAKGYEARNAERLLDGRCAGLLVVVYGDEAITKTGLKKAGKDSPILYYRKSSGGKWGRSAQTFRVSL